MSEREGEEDAGIIRSSRWEVNEAVGRAFKNDAPDPLEVQRVLDNAKEVEKRKRELDDLLRRTKTAPAQQPNESVPLGFGAKDASKPIKPISGMMKSLGGKK